MYNPSTRLRRNSSRGAKSPTPSACSTARRPSTEAKNSSVSLFGSRGSRGSPHSLSPACVDNSKPAAPCLLDNNNNNNNNNNNININDSNNLHDQTTPALTVSTSVTPPRSGRSAYIYYNIFSPPKSPFRPLRSNKRARSPVPSTLPNTMSAAVYSMDGQVSDQNMTSPALTAKNTPSAERNFTRKMTGKPKLPSFLTLDAAEVHKRFNDITWNERDRIRNGIHNPSLATKYGHTQSPRNLDRYVNVLPWNGNRVKLKVASDQNNYINASPVVLQSPLHKKNRPALRYIAMQGPLVRTVGHVWRMISEQLKSPAVVVMLTETYEANVEKCYPYFPHAVDKTIDIGLQDPFKDGFRAQIRCVSFEKQADGAIEMRKLNLHLEGREENEADMEIWHLLYKKWPDFGVPAMEDIGSFFELMRLSRELNASSDNPRVVHCSAGVGRSGTFMALESLVRELDSGDLKHYDEEHGGPLAEDLVFETVDQLREQRMSMVQAEAQFSFIYQVLRKLWIQKYEEGDGGGDDGGEPAAKRLEVSLDPFTNQ